MYAGLAVGEEKFMADASEVMDMLLKTHSEGDQLPADDPQTSYLISAWSRICRIMGKTKNKSTNSIKFKNLTIILYIIPK